MSLLLSTDPSPTWRSPRSHLEHALPLCDRPSLPRLNHGLSERLWIFVSNRVAANAPINLPLCSADFSSRTASIFGVQLCKWSAMEEWIFFSWGSRNFLESFRCAFSWLKSFFFLGSYINWIERCHLVFRIFCKMEFGFFFLDTAENGLKSFWYFCSIFGERYRLTWRFCKNWNLKKKKRKRRRKKQIYFNSIQSSYLPINFSLKKKVIDFYPVPTYPNLNPIILK